MTIAKKPKLGRGLDALLGVKSQSNNIESAVDLAAAETLTNLPIAQLKPGRYQPRSIMDAGKLQELADSIRAQGLIQPIIVRQLTANQYEIIAGERRWRAAQLAGLTEVLCVVRDIPDQAAIAMALIENIQRENLNPLEEALALQRLIDEFSFTHQQAASAVGRSRAAVSNLLRLLELPASIKLLLEQGQIEMGHARALLSLPEAHARILAEQVIELGWSVRMLEEKVRTSQTKPIVKSVKNIEKAKLDPNISHLQESLAEHLNTRVKIQSGRGQRGKLIIEYFSYDELDGILAKIGHVT